MSDKAFYSFIPWAKQGLGLSVNNTDSLTRNPAGIIGRTVLDVSITVASPDGQEVVQQQVELLGPGDILGINSQSVVRTEPKAGFKNFESNYLPYIEFYEEDFPWRYTPVKANGNKLRPWIFLFVLEESEFEYTDARPLPRIKILDSTVLPPFPEQSWAWAHVHVNEDLTATNLDASKVNFNALVSGNPDRAYSRVICPRKLEPNKFYHAFLVPAFEAGRLAGLGQDPSSIDVMLPSWGVTPVPASGPQTDFPVYYRWQFETGTPGDFEALVRKLIPNPPPPEIGKRPMDIQKSGFNLKYEVNSNKGVLDFEGALRIPGNPSSSFPDDTINHFKTNFQNIINLGESYKSATHTVGNSDPIVTPPLYGRWHARVSQLNGIAPNSSNWINEINGDPRWRAAAGLGTQIVRNNQEELMDIAWGQLGEILEANQRIRETQLATAITSSLYEKHIVTLSENKRIAMTGSVHKKILLQESGSTLTARKKIKNEGQPLAMVSSSYRKLARPGTAASKLISTNLLAQNGTITNEFLRSDLIGEVYSLNISPKPKTAPTGAGQYDATAPVGTQSVSTLPQTGVNDIIVENSTAYDINEYDKISRPAPQDLGTTSFSDAIKNALNPIELMRSRVLNNITKSGSIATEQVEPLMAYPTFKTPVVDQLQALSSDYIIPNIELIQENTITILENNQKFIEAFMTGLNHEMSRELLWREFPTDQRGTYFKQFWDSSSYAHFGTGTPPNLDNISAMDAWAKTDHLGDHLPSDAIAPLVLLIRGELLQKYPNAVIYAHKAKWQLKADNTIDFSKPRLLADDSTNPENVIKYPLFQTTIDPDITLLGFNLDPTVVKGDTVDPGYYFVIKERPGQIRFGLDIGSDTPATNVLTWNDLTWGHRVFSIVVSSGNPNYLDTSKTITATNNESASWNGSSADMATILYQLPVLVAVHAAEMLP